jgi:hypothetical protein
MRPTVSSEQRGSLPIDAIPPRREHAHMAPVPHGMGGSEASFEYQRRFPTRQQMRGSGQTDGPSTDDGYGQA